MPDLDQGGIFRKITKAVLFITLLFASPVQAQIIGTLPYTLTNGQVADANQVMANFNTIVNSTNANAATAGVNSNITALTGLTAPLNYTAGGTSLYLGGTSSNSGNAYTLASPTPTGFSLTVGKSVCFTANATNTFGGTTLNVASTGAINVFRQTANVGSVPMVGGEIVNGNMVCVFYDGTQYQCTTCGNPMVGALLDYSGAVVPAGWVLTNGQQVSRTVYAAAFNTLAYTSVSATTALTTTVTITGANTFLQVGWYVGGPNVTCNVTIVSVAANSIVISAAAGTAGATTLTIGPYPQGDCSTTFTVPNLTGRLTAGVDGTTNITTAQCTNSGSIGATCGGQTVVLATVNFPAYTPSGSISVTGHVGENGATSYNVGAGGTSLMTPGGSTAFVVDAETFTGNPQGGISTPVNKLPPLMTVLKIMKL